MNRYWIILFIYGIVLSGCVSSKSHSSKQITSAVQEKFNPDFTATGNSPQWRVDIDFEGKVRFSTRQGDTLSTTLSPMQWNDSTSVSMYTFASSSGMAEIRIYARACNSNTTEEDTGFQYEVAVKTTTQTYTGCGYYRAPILNLHDIWALESFHHQTRGHASFPNAVPVLEIHVASQTLRGRAGCGELEGRVVIKSNQSISFSELKTTATCSDQFEKKFLQDLQTVQSYTLKEGKLTLFTGGKEVMRLKKID